MGSKAISRSRRVAFRPKSKKDHLQSPEKPKKKKASKQREAARHLSQEMLEHLKGFEKEFIKRYNKGDSVASIYRHFSEKLGFKASENTLNVYTEWLISKRKVKRRKKKLTGRRSVKGLQEETRFKLDPHRKEIMAMAAKNEPFSNMVYWLARRGAVVEATTLKRYVGWVKAQKGK